MIEVKDLSKHFNGLKAVDSISFSIKEGEIFGFLGPNGAGKTTTISMLATLLKPTSGSASVYGKDIKADPDGVRRCIGIVFQDPSLDDDLTARENLDFHARMYNMRSEMRKKRINEVLKLVDLENKANVIVKTFSSGMRRRLEIARGLMHYPKVLFLDEPTLGLDPQTRAAIWEHIRMLNKSEKITVMLTTHYMEEADQLCDRIAIIDNGKIVVLDTPKNLKNQLGGDVLTFQTDEKEKLNSIISSVDGIKGIKIEEGGITVTVDNGEDKIPRIIKLADKRRIEINTVSLRKPTLDDVFLHYTGKRIREEKDDKYFQMRLRMNAMRGRR